MRYHFSALRLLFLISLGVSVMVSLRAVPQLAVAGSEPAAGDEILVATVPLVAGALLRAQDVTWQAIARDAEPGEIVRPSAAARAAKPEVDEKARAEVFGAGLRGAVVPGDPIRRGGIVKPADRDFLQVALSPGERAIAIPVTTGGASTGRLFPGDRVDVILTQNFREVAPLTRRSVSETVVENLRVVAIDVLNWKTAVTGGSSFDRTVTLEVSPEQAEKMNVAIDLGKLSVTLRSVSGPAGIVATPMPTSCSVPWRDVFRHNGPVSCW